MVKTQINSQILQIGAMILFAVIPFVHINHTIIYIFMELIGLYGILSFNKTILYDTFFMYYLWFFIWCIIVTVLSVNSLLSFKSLTTCIIPLFLLCGLQDGRILAKVDKLLLLCSLSLCLISFAFFLTVRLNIHVMPLYLIDSYGGGRITSSTLSMCIIVYTLFFYKTPNNRYFIIGLNIMSGLIFKDSAFVFTLVVTGFLYWAIIIRKIAIYQIVISIMLLIAIVQFILIHILHYNLHINERLHIYAYWFNKIFYSPIYGVGLGLKLESWFFTTHFPIAPELYKMDTNIALHAHNYLVDLLLQTGFIGLCIMLFFFYKISDAAYKHNEKYGFAVFFMVLVIIMKNLVDDEIDGSRGLIYWLFIIMTYVTVMKKSSNGEKI
ncbi:MAG: O-antigen ligase family protein [Burkholderiales bacterium]|nr:O-antigen ligase family protein [Burkholderiales bacterium]